MRSNMQFDMSMISVAMILFLNAFLFWKVIGLQQTNQELREDNFELVKKIRMLEPVYGTDMLKILNSNEDAKWLE